MHMFKLICFNDYMIDFKKEFWFIHTWYEYCSKDVDLLHQTQVRKQCSPNLTKETWILLAKSR